ncbi:MAG: aspartate/glutamate racemase family protein [Bacteroidales bacterium]|nr:aspartate/glutamate racemase family protein [Bacteroidales bacterium]MCM1146278.1 aspartate/glutamate racemase family protein [Bacteroidales bacterium]MCM1205284.1 aspartate/glutamate racemase family protein [Bacillota bacterium]MCM1509629.1 aspartate/glutamate racemase family protein [Clostridium sp.]
MKIVCVHTAMALVGPLTETFKRLIPEVEVEHIAESSLIKEVIANNAVTPAVRRRLLDYYNAAADSGADIIFNTCSSVGDIADLGNEICRIPVFRIDKPMAEKAVTEAKKIGVISTLPTTLGPTCRLLTNCAKEAGKEIELVEGLADGAFAAGQSGDGETHDRLIAEAAQKIADKVDMFVLAQGSMERMEKRLSELTGKPVLSSPALGVLGLRKHLGL